MPSGYEIERRFLVRVPDALWSGLRGGLRLRQGYVLAGKAASVRIRTGEPRGPVLTVKSGSGVKRREVETVVPREVAEALFTASERRVLEKVRFPIGPWELDRFVGSLSGLALLEIELTRVDETIPDPPYDVSILHEVTMDNRFTSAHLAHLTEAERQAFVAHVYEEVGG